MESNIFETKRKKMVDLLETFLPDEREIVAPVKDVALFRIEKSFERMPMIYESRIIILAQGQKTIYIANDTVTYNPSQYLFLSVPIALECEADINAEEPLMGFYININPLIIGEIILEMGDNFNHPVEKNPKGFYGAAITEDIMDAGIRFLKALSDKEDAKVLAPMIIREIIYRVLRGENGGALFALAHRNQRFFQIASILNIIHEKYNSHLDVSSLAEKAGMSVSTFHSSFKSVTNMPPLQYIKTTRLHKAKMLMTQEGLNAYQASMRVGYESTSQFNREYKRLFGITPGKDAISSRKEVLIQA